MASKSDLKKFTYRPSHSTQTKLDRLRLQFAEIARKGESPPGNPYAYAYRNRVWTQTDVLNAAVNLLDDVVRGLEELPFEH